MDSKTIYIERVYKITCPSKHIRHRERKHINTVYGNLHSSLFPHALLSLIFLLGLSPLTLDPKTAHPNLVLSKNRTSVWHGDIKQVMPDDPERFDSSVAVLGSKGFTSGKWYWEVEVAKKTKWTVGVVRESILRKGSCPLTPEQGFWLLRLRNQTDLKALDFPSCSLKLTNNLNKVGIYLDYEGGQVSFYNAKTMTHIYTFSSTFMEKLYPYFCPCLNDGGENKEPLHILHPQ